MRAPGAFVLIAMALTLLLASPAFAVVTVNITTDTGEPVPNATVTLETGETTTTDTQGKATFTTTPGEHSVTVTSNDTKRTRTRIVVPQDGTGAFTIPVDHLYPWMVQSPPLGGFGVGPAFRATRFDNLRLSRETLRDLTARFGPFITNSGKEALQQANTTRNTSLALDEFLVDVPFGGPSFDLFDCLTFNTAFSLLGGGNHVSIRERNRDNAASTTKVDGDGFSYGGSLELGFSIKQGHRDHMPLLDDTYFRMGFEYSGGEADINRAPLGSGGTGLFGATILDEYGTASWQTQRAFVHVGRSFLNDTIMPFVGAQYVQEQFDIATNSFVTVPGTGPVKREIRHDLIQDTIMGVAGVDFRPFGTLTPVLGPLYGRVEVDFDKQNVLTFVKLVYQFDQLPFLSRLFP
jgi:hypothetical protein